MTRRFERVFCFSGANSPQRQLAYCSNPVNARIILPSTTQRGRNMNQRIINFIVTPDENGHAVLIAGADNKPVASTDIPRIGHINEVIGVNQRNARRVAACLNACDGIDSEALEAMPASFNTLLSDAFMSVLKLPEVATTIHDEQARDFIAAWNAMPLTGPTIVAMQASGDLLPPVEIEQIAWLQKAHTLHRQVSMLYVVDGYEVTVTLDENPISEAFHGETLREAISNAMAGHDLDARPHPYTDNQLRYPEDAQRTKMLNTLKGIRAHIEKISPDHWWIDTPDRGGFDTDELDAIISEFEGGDV
jgi:hypothetical protein